MAAVQGTKPLSSRTVETMKPGDKIKADTGESIGLRVKCGATGLKTFFYRLIRNEKTDYSITTFVIIFASISSCSACCRARSEIFCSMVRSSSM